MDDSVIPFDIARLFFGDAPVGFYAEIVFRTVAVYVWTLVLLRWIGGRSVAQLSLVEFLLVIALGSAVGDAMFYPEVPLLHALAVVTLVVVISKAIDLLILHSGRVKKAVDGRPVRIVEDGRILHEGLVRRSLGMPELCAMLRQKGVANLGEIRVAWMEPAGQVSVFRHPAPRPGLAIEPPPEVVPPPPPGSGDAAVCCTSCGAVAAPPPPEGTACVDCGGRGWTGARTLDPCAAA